MTIQRVAVPLFRGKRRFHLLKGRPWSPAEHLMLQAVARQSRTAAELSAASGLPRRVVLEMLIRLMRVGWIEISTSPGGTLFSATPTGVDRAGWQDLPTTQRSQKRWISFFVDRITGTPYRGREFQGLPKHKLEERTRGERIIWLEPKPLDLEPREIFTSLTGDDEQITGAEPSNEKLSEQYALVTVTGGKIDGLPARSPPSLSSAIQHAVAQASSSLSPPSSETHISVADYPLEPNEPTLVDAVFGPEDLILGGDAHKVAFLGVIRRAKSRLIIHSTFISEAGLEAALPALKEAAHRSVRIDIFWGQSEGNKGADQTKELLRKMRAQLDADGLGGLLQFHLFSTNSHAKLIVADNISSGEFFAIVGSCNWLSTSFASFDASVRVREPALVADVINVLSKLSCGRGGYWLEITTDLARLSIEVGRRKSPVGAKVKSAIVLGADHGYFVRKARDELHSRIFVTSHRLSEVANRAIVLPAIAATENRSGTIVGNIFYNVVSGAMTEEETRTLAATALGSAVKIQPVYVPRLHAKILAWDDNSIVITSLNWLSADSSADQPLQEVGIFFSGRRAADQVIAIFENARLI